MFLQLLDWDMMIHHTYSSDVKMSVKTLEIFGKFSSRKLHSKRGTIITRTVDRLGGKFIGFIVFNQ